MRRNRQLIFVTDTSTPEIYTLSLHDALPISSGTASTRANARSTAAAIRSRGQPRLAGPNATSSHTVNAIPEHCVRSEEHTSELQSHVNLVCRLLLEKKKKIVNGTGNNFLH